MTEITEIITQEQLDALAAAGFAVLVRVPSIAMIDAGIAGLTEFGVSLTGRPEDAVAQVWSRMVFEAVGPPP